MSWVGATITVKKNITHVKYIGCCQDVIAVFLRFFPAKLLEVMDYT